jgi:hypothetical protein
MARQKLPERRSSLTLKVPYTAPGGKQVNLLITVGFEEPGRPLEVFCASFLAGSDLQATVMDACILLSRLYQHGDAPEEVAKTLDSDSPSLICVIARAARDAFVEPLAAAN